MDGVEREPHGPRIHPPTHDPCSCSEQGTYSANARKPLTTDNWSVTPTFDPQSRMAMSTFPLSILLGVIGPWQIVLVVVVLLLLFGGKKIPELMRGLGQGMKEFKDASKNEDKPKDEGK